MCTLLCGHSPRFAGIECPAVCAESHGKCMFSFLRHSPTVFQSSCTPLRSHEHWVRSGFSAPCAILSGFHFSISTRCDGVEQLVFIDIIISSSVKFLSMPFAHFITGSYHLPLSFESCLYIINMGPLSDMWSARIFSLSVACLFILLTGASAEQKFYIFRKFNLLGFFFSFID